MASFGLEPPGVPRVVELAEAVGARGAEVEALRQVGRVLVALALPDARPSDDDRQLDGEEDHAGDDDADEADAQAVVVALQVYGAHLVAVPRGARGLVAVEPELVRDLDGLHEQQVLPRGAAPPPPPEGLDAPQLAGVVLLVALYRLAGRHAGSHQRAELDHLGGRELERVEVREQHLEMYSIS